LDKEINAARPPPSFDFKYEIGRTGFDPTNCEEVDGDVYKAAKERIIEDTVLISNVPDTDEINCFHFAGFHAGTCCSSITIQDVKINMFLSHEHEEKLLMATADALGRTLLWELQTTETALPMEGEDEEEEIDRTIQVD